LGTWYSTAYVKTSSAFTISEVGADWHELMILQRIMQPSIIWGSEQLNPRCSQQIHCAQISHTRLKVSHH